MPLKSQPLNTMDEKKVSSSQTTLTQFHRDECVITESAVQHEMASSDRLIQSPGDVRRALRGDQLMKNRDSDFDRVDRVVNECQKRHYLDEDDFYADFNRKQRRNQNKCNNKKRKYVTSTTVLKSKVVSPSSSHTASVTSTLPSLSHDEIITRYNMMVDQNKSLERKYHKACKLARCLTQQLSTVHYATQQPTAQQVINTKFIDIDELLME